LWNADLTDAASVNRAFETVVSKAGRIDILVNSAGGFHMQLAIIDTRKRNGMPLSTGT